MDAIIASGATNVTSGDDGSVTVQVMNNIQTQTPPTPPVIAEANTPEIQALADGLQDDPLKIYNYVHDHIRHVLYFGSKKGAQLTLLEKSGNDFDQCALLVALLRAANYPDAAYEFGWMLLPYDSTDGSDRDIHHWLNLDLNNNNWSATTSFLDYLFKSNRDYPITAYNWGNNVYGFQRVCVTVTVGGTKYILDPAFKVTERVSGINLPQAMNFYLTDAGTAAPHPTGLTETVNNGNVTEFGDSSGLFYATNLDEVDLQYLLGGYTANLLGYIQSNCPNASVQQILGGDYIVPSACTNLSQALVFPFTNWSSTMPVITNWINEPTNMMATMAISYEGTNSWWYMPQLQGQRLALTVNSSGLAQLSLDDTNVASGHTGGGAGTFILKITTYYPGFLSSWDTSLNTFIPGPSGQQWEWKTNSYQNANATYAILYAFDPDWGWLQEREKKLEAYRQQYSDTSPQVVGETLNVMGLDWQIQVEAVQRIIARNVGVLGSFRHRIGRMAQEKNYGYYVDVYMAEADSTSSSSMTDNHPVRWLDECGFFGSAMEHGLIEQQQSTNLIGASTVKILELANASYHAIYLANTNNWSTIQTNLTNYSSASIKTIGADCASGESVLIPQDGQTQIAGPGSWKGYGMFAHDPRGSIAMLIGDSSGVHDGGYVSDPTAIVDPSWIYYSSYSQPFYFDSSPMSLPPLTGADPVDMADGTFQVSATDLSIGQTEPRGMSFSHYYNSSRRNSNLAGMAPGWVHNYYAHAATISDPQAGLGGTTPSQMAAMIVATTVLDQVYNGDQPDPWNWMVTDLIAKWGIDQLTGKAVSISLGKDTFEFIQQPGGSDPPPQQITPGLTNSPPSPGPYTPPANCTMTLSEGGSGYSLQERHGRTFNFNSSGWATSIVDPYNQSLNITYTSSNWVSTVTDWKNRTLTLNYSTTNPKHLTSVVDSTGRTISFGYDATTNVSSISGPENNTNSFLYDTNHQIVATYDALGRLVASNIYNSFGRVTTQYTQGDPNKIWKIFWSGWQTTEQDPAGGQRTHFFDDQSRQIAFQDALGNFSQTVYDGNDHIVMSISPLNETNQFLYDSNNNVVAVIDPLGFSNQFFYDGNNNLIRELDPRGNVSTFGYNSESSLTGTTNAAGDWTTYSYNTDGTLATKTDPAGSTTNTYDGYGQLSSITYPNGLGSETFANDPLGDVTSHTDGRGFVTYFYYNARRLLTNTVAPNSLTVKAVYDAVGNQVAAIDARGNATSNIWSTTRKLLAVKLPATPQGSPVITNIYDNRDWLIQTLDPLQRVIQFVNDAGAHLIAVTDPLSQTGTFGYDADGHSIAQTNAIGEVIRRQWDTRGNLTKFTDGAGRSVLPAYDPAGNEITLTNRKGKVWQFQFDPANHLTAALSPRGATNSLSYDARGLLVSATDPAGQTTTLNYDAKGRLTNRIDSVASTFFNYDLNDNPTNISETINSPPSILNFTYDAYNRVSSYTDSGGNLIQYRYDASGNVTNLIYPGGKTVAYSYDNLNRLTNVTDWAGRRTAFTYDLASHVTSVARPNGTVRTINYDAAGQATNIIEKTTWNYPIAFFTCGFNGASRMQWEFGAPLPHSNSLPTRTMAYDDDNRLTTVDGNSVAVDSDGNLTSGPLTNDTFATYSYDARNRLLNVSGVTNFYDLGNNRIGEAYGTNSISYVIDVTSKLPQVLMRIKNGVTNYYIYGSGLLYQITETSAGTNTLTYHYDYRGSTVALTGDNGLPTDQIEYSAYGTTTYRSGTNDTPFLFNGKYGVQTDPSGLLYMQSRFYSPYLCRFINPDPSGFAGGLNFYAYANGNPVTLVDPFGLGALGESGLDSSMFHAPTPESQQAQQVLAGFVNLATLGLGNLISSITTGNDLAGNPMNSMDAFQQALQTGVDGAMLGLSLVTDGGSLEAEGALEAGLGETTTEEAAAEEMASTGWGPVTRGENSINVNPTRNDVNCVNCAIATEYTVRGYPCSALPTSGGLPNSLITKEFGGSFVPVYSPSQIGNILSESGDGASGIVIGVGNTSHAWNAVNEAGNIRFLDGQWGLEGPGIFDDFHSYWFVLTTPGR